MIGILAAIIVALLGFYSIFNTGHYANRTKQQREVIQVIFGIALLVMLLQWDKLWDWLLKQ